MQQFWRRCEVVEDGTKEGRIRFDSGSVKLGVEL